MSWILTENSWKWMQMGDRRGDMRPTGNMGGRRSGMSGRGRPQMNIESIEPINFWVNTVIASN